MNNTKQVTVNLSENTFRRLQALANAMNQAEWMDTDNTVESVIEEFCLHCDDIEEIKENILMGVDYGTNDDLTRDVRADQLKTVIEGVE